MRRILIILLIFLLGAVPICRAEDWDDFSGLDKAWDGQKSITNKEFEQAIDTLEKNQKILKVLLKRLLLEKVIEK